MNNKSIWESEVEVDSFPFLNEDIETDVLIIGGGITGLLCAYELKKRNIDCVIAERDKIGKGITKNTTAFITAQHEVLYQDLIGKHGEKKAKEYLMLNLQAIKKYKELGANYDIDFKECTSTLFSNESEDKIAREKVALDSLGYPCNLVDSLPLDIPIKKGLEFKNQATLHPLKLVKNISKELKIYEKTGIERLKSNYAYTKNHKIKFNNVIIATHFPFINHCGLYFMKMYQRRSYVVALKNKKIEGTFCSIDPNGLYFRSHGDYLIVGGNDRDTKNICKCNFEKEVTRMFKDKDIEYSWSNQDCITLDEIPYIGQYSILYKNWYVATGFNLWGFTWAMISSWLLADLIEKKEKHSLVSPQRNMFNKQLLSNIGTTFKNMFTLRTPRCSHLKTALLYNKIENTWECPSHGSRFDKKGNVLDGPAQKKKIIR